MSFCPPPNAQQPPSDDASSRRDLLKTLIRYSLLGSVAAGAAALAARSKTQSEKMVWQLDPRKCIACGNCATYCVLDESAVKCLHDFPMCGYCDLCTGYFEPEPVALQTGSLNTGAENQLCPTGALRRQLIEEPYFEYKIDAQLCIGCGKCVKGCTSFGNGSLYLQVCHDRCQGCNECAIAVACPSQAFQRVPASNPYLSKRLGKLA